MTRATPSEARRATGVGQWGPTGEARQRVWRDDVPQPIT